MIIAAALSLAAQLANPGFERGLEGWRSDRHRGMGIEIRSNRGHTIRRSAEGEHYLAMGWRARSAAPQDARSRVFQEIDARRYRNRTIRVSARTQAPEFAHRRGTLTVTAGGARVRAAIDASDGWRRQAVVLRVPRNARTIGVAFQVEGTGGELSVDDVRLTILR
jgi:hypothetical protein